MVQFSISLVNLRLLTFYTVSLNPKAWRNGPRKLSHPIIPTNFPNDKPQSVCLLNSLYLFMLPTVKFIFIGPRTSFLQEDNLSEMKWKFTLKSIELLKKFFLIFTF